MHRLRRPLVAGSAVGLLFLGLTGFSTPAGAAPVAPACGSTITSDTTLRANVGPCNSGDGLVLKGSNFTLNMNGYKVFSDATLPRNTGVDNEGFFIPADVVGIKLLNATGVTVKNGKVDSFAAGISIENGASNVVRNVTAQNNQGPCIGEDFSSFAEGSYGDGIVVFGSPNNKLLNNTIRNNGPFSGIALVANNTFITTGVPPFPSGNLIDGNRVLDNNTCFADIGVRVEGPGASNTRVTNNIIKGSFNEGITVNPVNVIDFRPLFQSPPACQNRGFPSPTLPQCPIQNPLNPTNDNNLIKGNTVVENGFGGQPQQAGPNLPLRALSLQNATGINLLSFCGYGARSNATGNVVEGNTSKRNAGDGITVGGCPLGQNPATGTFPGYQNTLIRDNISLENGQRGCGVLPAPTGCGSNPATQRFDLRDSTNQITCPSRNATTQAICATLGFPAPPANPPPPAPATPFVGTFVIQPGGVPCGTNIWFGNTYGTAFPECTTNGGRQVASAPASASPAASPSQAQGASPSQDRPDDLPYPLRGRKQ